MFRGFGADRAGLDGYPLLIAAEHCGSVQAEADINAFGYEIFAPVFVEVVQIGESDHGGEIGQESVWRVIPKFHVSVIEKALENGTRDVGSLVSCSQKERDERIDHFVTKIFAEEEHFEHYSDRDYAEDRHRPLDDPEDTAELFDV